MEARCGTWCMCGLVRRRASEAHQAPVAFQCPCIVVVPARRGNQWSPRSGRGPHGCDAALPHLAHVPDEVLVEALQVLAKGAAKLPETLRARLFRQGR